ncbi:MAG: response regulator [Chloroflexi bacterium]|nr:response regulator [Chloroflexota bacterium]
MSKKILIVEDEDVIREVLCSWLEEADYQTLTASNGLTGLEAIHQHDPDLIVADIMMPQLDGIELCRLTRETSGTPILLLTGLGGEEHMKAGYKVGATDYLVKPVDMEDFLTKVSYLLQQERQSPAPSISAFTKANSGF